MLENCEALVSSIWKMENTKKPSKTQGEVGCLEAAMPCEKETKKHLGHQETVARSDESNKIEMTNPASIVESHESTRKRLESSLPKNHEDRIAGKGHNSMSYFDLVDKFIPMPAILFDIL